MAAVRPIKKRFDDTTPNKSTVYSDLLCEDVNASPRRSLPPLAPLSTDTTRSSTAVPSSPMSGGYQYLFGGQAKEDGEDNKAPPVSSGVVVDGEAPTIPPPTRRFGTANKKKRQIPIDVHEVMCREALRYEESLLHSEIRRAFLQEYFTASEREETRVKEELREAHRIAEERARAAIRVGSVAPVGSFTTPDSGTRWSAAHPNAPVDEKLFVTTGTSPLDFGLLPPLSYSIPRSDRSGYERDTTAAVDHQSVYDGDSHFDITMAKPAPPARAQPSVSEEAGAASHLANLRAMPPKPPAVADPMLSAVFQLEALLNMPNIPVYDAEGEKKVEQRTHSGEKQPGGKSMEQEVEHIDEVVMVPTPPRTHRKKTSFDSSVNSEGTRALSNPEKKRVGRRVPKPGIRRRTSSSSSLQHNSAMSAVVSPSTESSGAAMMDGLITAQSCPEFPSASRSIPVETLDVEETPKKKVHQTTDTATTESGNHLSEAGPIEGSSSSLGVQDDGSTHGEQREIHTMQAEDNVETNAWPLPMEEAMQPQAANTNEEPSTAAPAVTTDGLDDSRSTQQLFPTPPAVESAVEPNTAKLLVSPEPRTIEPTVAASPAATASVTPATSTPPLSTMNEGAREVYVEPFVASGMSMEQSLAEEEALLTLNLEALKKRQIQRAKRAAQQEEELQKLSSIPHQRPCSADARTEMFEKSIAFLQSFEQMGRREVGVYEERAWDVMYHHSEIERRVLNKRAMRANTTQTSPGRDEDDDEYKTYNTSSNGGLLFSPSPPPALAKSRTGRFVSSMDTGVDATSLVRLSSAESEARDAIYMKEAVVFLKSIEQPFFSLLELIHRDERLDRAVSARAGRQRSVLHWQERMQAERQRRGDTRDADHDVELYGGTVLPTIEDVFSRYGKAALDLAFERKVNELLQAEEAGRSELEAACGLAANQLESEHWSGLGFLG